MPSRRRSLRVPLRALAALGTALVLLVPAACALPTVRELEVRPSRHAGAARVLIEHVAAVEAPMPGASLALESARGRASLRYGADWFGTPGAAELDGEVVFAGLSDDLLQGVPDAARGRVLLVLLPSTTVDEMMESAALVHVRAQEAGARGVLFALTPSFDEVLVGRAAAALEQDARAGDAAAPDSADVPTWFVRYEPLAEAAGRMGLDLPALARDAIHGAPHLVLLAGLRVDTRSGPSTSDSPRLPAT